MAYCSLQKCLGIDIWGIRRQHHMLVAATLVSRLAYNTGVVTAASQHEGDVGARRNRNFIDRAPGCDMILGGSEGEDWDADVTNRDRASADGKVARCKLVSQEHIC